MFIRLDLKNIQNYLHLRGPLMRLSSIIRESELDLEKVVLFRHNMSNREVKTVYEQGFLNDYQSLQGRNDLDQLLKQSEYVLSFLGTTGTRSLFLGCYKIGNKYEGAERQAKKPKGYPFEKKFDEGYYYEMIKCGIMSDMEKRLVVDWGKDPINWFKRATKELEVLEIRPDINSRQIEPFRNYEELILSFDQLVAVTENQDEYADYYQALNSVNGIYLICDTETGKQYIGTTYGQEGIWGRWSGYAKTQHNGNTGIIYELDKRPDLYKKFQYTILRVLQSLLIKEKRNELKIFIRTNYAVD